MSEGDTQVPLLLVYSLRPSGSTSLLPPSLSSVNLTLPFPVNFQLSMAAKLQVPGAGNEAAAAAPPTPAERPIPAFHYLDVYSKDLLVQSLVQVRSKRNI